MLGIALVVDDPRKGPRLAYSYPLGLTAGAGVGGTSGTASGGAGGPVATAGATLQSAADHEAAGADYFAKLLRPTDALCNQPWELSVDDTLFISYPITFPTAAIAAPAPAAAASPLALPPWLTEDDTVACAVGDGAGPPALGTTMSPSPSSPQLSLLNIALVTRQSAPPRSARVAARLAPAAASAVDDSGSASGGKALSPLTATSRALSEGGPLLLGEHAAVLASSVGAVPQVSAGADADAYLADVLDDMEADDAHALLLRSLRDAAHRIAAALAYEERRCGYVSVTVAAASGGRLAAPSQSWDAVLPSLTTLRASGGASPSAGGGATGSGCGGEGGLAWELAFIFHSLQRGLGCSCHVTFNGSISVSLSLSPVSETSTTSHLHTHEEALVDRAMQRLHSGHPHEADAGLPAAAMAETWATVFSVVRSGATSSGASGYDTMMPIRPYHTLLLLREAQELLAILPPDAAPQLAQLILAASPRRSFQQLQREIAIPSSQLLRMAAHLVHWNMAVIVHVITGSNVYTISPHASLHRGSAAQVEFDRLYDVPMARHSSRSGKTEGPADWAVASAAPDSHHFSFAEVLAIFSKPITRAVTTLWTAASPTGMRGSDAGTASATGIGPPLSTLMAAMRRPVQARFLDIVSWLLKHGIITQMHTHIYLLWPWEIHPAPSPSPPPPTAGAAPLSPGISAPAPAATAAGGAAAALSDAEYAYGATLAHGQLPAMQAVFWRLLVYLRDTMARYGPDSETAAFDGSGALVGLHRVVSVGTDLASADGMSALLRLGLRAEEVMWRLNLSRDDLLAVVAAFPEVFLAVVHE